MARDPAGTYSYPPGVEGHPDATIESGDYNAFLLDVQADLNFPRPISSGGTNATTAQGALTNLGGELASQVVTNYNSFPFSSGSFYSMAGATGEPVAGHNFIGICYVGADTSNMVIQARDESDTQVPGRLYVREKKAGTWSAWKVDGRTSTTDNGGGDVITGIAGDIADMFFGLRGTAPTSNFIVNTRADLTGVNALSVSRVGATSVGGTLSVIGGATFTSTVTLSTAPSAASDATTKTYVDTADATKLDKTGGTITSNLTVNGGLFTPTVTAGAASTEVVTAAWVRNYGQAKDPQLFAGIPINGSSNYTTVAADAQKCIAGTGTITINGGLYGAGTVISFIANGSTMVIANTQTMYWNNAGAVNTGSRTLSNVGVATAICIGGAWMITGNGLT